MKSWIKRTVMTALACMLLAAIAGPQPAQADRWKTTPTGWYWLTNASEDDVNGKVAEGFRVTNIEIEDTSPYRFTALFVRNNGVHYQATWGWYFDQTAGQVDGLLNGQPVRAIDIEAYAKDGQTRYATVYIGNSGPSAKGSWHFTNKTWDEVGDLISLHSARLIDLDTRIVSGTRKFDGVLLANTGADAVQWWRYSSDSVDSAFVSQKLAEHDARLIDIERRDDSSFSVVMQKKGSELWWWYRSRTEAQVNELLATNGARLIDIEVRMTALGKRFDVIMLNNSNALTTKVGNAMRVATDGDIGFGLKVVNGPMLASINRNRIFYPASMIKIMQHIHAMRWAAVGNPPGQPMFNLGTLLPVFASSCNNSGLVTPTALQTSMQRMMRNSDNEDTNAIQDFFGRAAISQTMQNVLGLSQDTRISNKLGCGGGNLATTPNQATVNDMLKTYEAVANGVIPAAYEEQFRSRMSSELNTTGGTFDDLIDAQAADLGLSNTQREAFRAQMRWIAKGGSWTDANGDRFATNAGLVSLPIKTCSGIQQRELAFSWFVDKYTTLDASLSTTVLLFEGEFRAALSTFKMGISECLPGFGFVPADVPTPLRALNVAAGGMTFTFMPGSFDDDLQVAFGRVGPVNPPKGKQLVGDLLIDVALLRDGRTERDTQPKVPVALELTYAPELAKRMASAKLYARASADGEWTEASASCPTARVLHQANARTLTVDVCHFSQFALFDDAPGSVFLPALVR